VAGTHEQCLRGIQAGEADPDYDWCCGLVPSIAANTRSGDMGSNSFGGGREPWHWQITWPWHSSYSLAFARGDRLVILRGETLPAVSTGRWCLLACKCGGMHVLQLRRLVERLEWKWPLATFCIYQQVERVHSQEFLGRGCAWCADAMAPSRGLQFHGHAPVGAVFGDGHS
jgi:hypothetical protein